ncbi:MAG: hypothetical protein ACOX87_04430 [Chloroflexota bacterium]|jgi:hypothetical protein
MDDFHHRIPPWAITLTLHNWPIMLYSVFGVWAAIRAYLQPNRPALLLLYGFLTLAFAFEYQKHGLEPVRGTLDYVFARLPDWRNAGYLILLDILPIALHLLGFAFLALSWLQSQPRCHSGKMIVPKR